MDCFYLQTPDHCSSAQIPGLEQQASAGAHESVAIGGDGKRGNDLGISFEPPQLLSSLDLDHIDILAHGCDQILFILRYADLSSSVDGLDRLCGFEAGSNHRKKLSL